MNTLRQLLEGKMEIPLRVTWYLSDIGRAQGIQDLHTRQSPQRRPRYQESRRCHLHRPRTRRPMGEEVMSPSKGKSEGNFIFSYSLDPRNGLCISATYNKAFDQHLITLDEDYKLVISKSIRDHFTNEYAKELFENGKGR